MRACPQDRRHASLDAVEQAYADYDREMSDAWRKPDDPGQSAVAPRIVVSRELAASVQVRAVGPGGPPVGQFQGLRPNVRVSQGCAKFEPSTKRCPLGDDRCGGGSQGHRARIVMLGRNPSTKKKTCALRKASAAALADSSQQKLANSWRRCSSKRRRPMCSR